MSSSVQCQVRRQCRERMRNTFLALLILRTLMRSSTRVHACAGFQEHLRYRHQTKRNSRSCKRSQKCWLRGLLLVGRVLTPFSPKASPPQRGIHTSKIVRLSLRSHAPFAFDNDLTGKPIEESGLRFGWVSDRIRSFLVLYHQGENRHWARQRPNAGQTVQADGSVSDSG